LGEYPLIRYDGEGVATKQLAAMVQSRLDDLQRDDPDAFTDGPKSTLLILDRAVDVVAPFLHEFTYQVSVFFSFLSLSLSIARARRSHPTPRDNRQWFKTSS